MPYKRLATSYWLVGGLCVALVVLAGLQYRWSGQVSEAERARMRANLQIAVSQFRQDFSRDLLNLCSGFQADAATLEKRDWDQLARQGSEWLRTSPEAGLVSGVYLWQADKGDSLLRLNRASQRFEAAATTPDLETLLAPFRAQSGENPQGRPFRMMTWTLETKPPALIHPLYTFPESGERARPVFAGFVAIKINAQYLEEKFLPDLAARHFAGPDGFLYKIAILTGDDLDHPLYRSDAVTNANLTAANIATADVNVAMFEPRPRPPNGGGPGRGGRRRDGAEGPGQLGFRFQPPGPPPDDNAQRDRYRAVSRFAAMQPLSLSADPRSQLRLIARHRAGSVDTAVAQARWRDLALSFAILMLLGASMVLIVVSAQRAQRLARCQMEFVAGVSHELRTPLTVISSAAQNLTDGIVEGKPQIKLYGTLIRNESRRLTGMMEQILQFAAADQKKRAYEPVPLAPAELIDNALALGASLIQETGTNVEREIPASMPNIMGEPGALMQCLHNLIVNAVKYGGEAKWLRIRAWADEDYVRIAVEDRGIGIERAELPHIFDAFYRSPAVSSAQIHGTGLGLNLARNFAREAGGTISVESTPGQGSTFTVRLPAVRAVAALESVNLAERTV